MLINLLKNLKLTSQRKVPKPFINEELKFQEMTFKESKYCTVFVVVLCHKYTLSIHIINIA